MQSRIANRRFELVSPDPEWGLIAERESIRIKRALGDSVLQIEHIGSTSIPGIRAKPIIDLMPIVTSFAALDCQRDLLESLGYEWRGEFGFPGRRYCIFNDPKTGTRKFHAHFYQEGFFEIERYIAFREYLRHFDAEARALAWRKASFQQS